MIRKAGLLLFLIIITGCSQQEPRQSEILQMDTTSSPVKVLVIGFDGATWDMFGPAMKKGYMPRLKAVVDAGATAALETMKPTITPIIWTTIATGKLPQEHGVQSVVDRDPDTGEMRPLTSRTIQVKTIWEILSDQGKDVTVVRWPVTWPANRVNGEMVSDFAFQSSRNRRVWPESLSALVSARQVQTRLEDIESLTGINEQIYNGLAPLWQWKMMVLLREYILDIQFKDIAKTLFEQKHRDFSAIYFYSLDALGHNYYKFVNENPDNEGPDFSELVMNWCWLYDQFLNEILASVDEETHVLICSDHGMDLAIKPQNFLIRAENMPPDENEDPQEALVPPAPPYNTDPFTVSMQYTAPSGQHVEKPDGILVMKGPHFRQNNQRQQVKITEIAPTILYLMGLAVPQDFASEPRSDLLTPEFVTKHEIKRIATYEKGARRESGEDQEMYSQENDLLLNRLEALGYIQ